MIDPISTDGTVNIKHFQDLCASEPRFYFREEAKLFLERCIATCSASVHWLRYYYFHLLIQRKELREALTALRGLLEEPDLPEASRRSVRLVSALAYADLGEPKECLRILIDLYSQYRDIQIFHQLYTTIRETFPADSSFQQALVSLSSKTETCAYLRKLLEMPPAEDTDRPMISEAHAKLHQIASLPSQQILIRPIQELGSQFGEQSKEAIAHETPSIEIYSIPGASISFMNEALGIFDSEGSFFEPLSSGLASGPVLAQNGLHLSGRTALISDSFIVSNYCHWIYDTLPRINYIRRIEAGEIDNWIVPSTKGSFVASTIRALGIDPSSLVSLEDHPRIVTDQLIATSNSANTEHPARLGWQQNLEFIRSNLFPIADAQLSSRSSGRRILISRSDTQRRVLLGEQELFNELQDRFNSEILSPGTLTIEQQIARFAEAEIVVGSHGAGLTNIVFCRPGTLVIEIFPPHYGTYSYSCIANSLNLEYRRLTADDLNAENEPAYLASKSQFFTAGSRSLSIGIRARELIVDEVRKYLSHRPSLHWEQPMKAAVKISECPLEITEIPVRCRSRPELWLNRGFSCTHLPDVGMIDIHGVRGYLSRGDVSFLYHIARSIPLGGCLLEIGSFLGLSSIIFANGLLSNGNDSARIFCVDTWLGSVEHQGFDWIRNGEAYELFTGNITAAGVFPIISPLRMLSTRAAKLFNDGSLDAIFIDGDHSYQGCLEDLRAWWPKCKRGGYFFGHDAGPFPVVDAVRDFAQEHNLKLEIHGEHLYYMWVMSEVSP